MKKFILTPVLLLLAAASSYAGSAGISQSGDGTKSTQVTLPNAGTYQLEVYTSGNGGFAVAEVGTVQIDVYGPYQNSSKSGAIAAGTYSLEVSATSVGGYASSSVSW
jgi:hypothetical protein